MAVTTSTVRPDGIGGDDGRRSRRCNLRTGVRGGGRRAALKGSSVVEGGSVSTRRGASGKFLLVGAVLAIQFVGAAAISNKAGGDIIVEFKMPREAEVGSSINLSCEWRILGGRGLYSVKWYKDDHEIFRYMPDYKRVQVFLRPGVKLVQSVTKPDNESKSMRLMDLVLESSGQYKCEVSTEGPSFATTYQTANLTVISLPERGPEITGLSLHYAVGENVTANCTAWPSVPKANLRWTINDEPVARENVIQHPPLTPMNTGGIPNSLGLRLEAEPRHFGRGLVRIKCTAEVGSRVYEAERKVLMAYVNNQRLSAGDHIHAAARGVHRSDLLAPLLTATTLVLVLLTT